MRSRPTHTKGPHRGLLALAILGCLAGCSKTSPMQPGPAPVESRLDAPSPSSVLHVWSPPSPQPARATSLSPIVSVPAANPSPGAWREIGRGRVSPGQCSSIRAGRYTLLIEPGTVDSSTVFSISAYDSTVLDVELGPHGLAFGKPVTLTVCYGETNADPDCPAYDGSQPGVVWYDEDSGVWTPVPGVIDSKSKTVTVKLTHFSRYAVQKASW